MSGGGDQLRTFNENDQSLKLQPITSKAVVISDSSAALNHADTNPPLASSKDDTQDGLSREALVVIHSKKLQDDLQELGQKIKHHEDNVKYLKNQNKKLEESIVEMKATVEKYHISSFSTLHSQELAHARSEEETLSHFLEHEKSAAALLSLMKKQSSDHPLTKDVLGIVASLGKIDNDNLSRLLSEYLGLDIMLSVVCKTYNGAKSLEAYNKDGSINKSLGLQAFAASTGLSLEDPFLVICLEGLRPYPGEFIADDPQRRLDLLKPRLGNGETPTGFLGFAVNMISIEKTHLYYVTENGLGLRETLFYNLFSRLQVYRSRDDMLKALPYIPNGAISLDGGMIKSPGILRLGPRVNVRVKFPIGSERVNPAENFLELENQLKEKIWKKDRVAEDLQREEAYLDHSRVKYETKKREFIQFLAESSAYTAPVGRTATPR